MAHQVLKMPYQGVRNLLFTIVISLFLQTQLNPKKLETLVDQSKNSLTNIDTVPGQCTIILNYSKFEF